MSESLRDKSRRIWANDSNTNEQIQLGCILRIADATEKMAQRHTELIRERDQFKSSMDYWRNEAERMGRSNNALRGQITKLKKRLAAKEPAL